MSWATATTAGRSEPATRIRKLFETDCDVFFVFSGTAANALALAHLCRPYNAVIAHAASHVASDEAGAAGFFSGGAKAAHRRHAARQADARGRRGTGGSGRRFHSVKPRALSLTQATEMGTVYRLDEMRALTAVPASTA